MVDIRSTICAGSSILLLAEVSVERSQLRPTPRKDKHRRQQSDELIEDLEFELGDTRMDYMQIRVSYSHSFFPNIVTIETLDGVSNLQSTMETMATASLKVCNGQSVWSPLPAPAPNALFQLIVQHWGQAKAEEAMQKILAQKSTPRKPARAANNRHQGRDTDDASWMTVDSNVDLTKSARKLDTPVPADEPHTPVGDETVPQAGLPTLKSWLAERVQEQSRADGTLNSSRASNYLSCVSQSEDLADLDRQQKQVHVPNFVKSNSKLSGLSGASSHWNASTGNLLRKKHSFGASSVRNWFPGFSVGGSTDGDRKAPSLRKTPSVRTDGKDTSRWDWASWF